MALFDGRKFSEYTEAEKAELARKHKDFEEFNDRANQGMTKDANNKSRRVRFICSACEQEYYARNMAEMYICPLCGNIQQDDDDKDVRGVDNENAEIAGLAKAEDDSVKFHCPSCGNYYAGSILEMHCCPKCGKSVPESGFAE